MRFGLTGFIGVGLLASGCAGSGGDDGSGQNPAHSGMSTGGRRYDAPSTGGAGGHGSRPPRGAGGTRAQGAGGAGGRPPSIEVDAAGADAAPQAPDATSASDATPTSDAGPSASDASPRTEAGTTDASVTLPPGDGGDGGDGIAPTLLHADRRLGGITAAAWNGATGEFFLLAPAERRFFRASTGPQGVAVSGPFDLPPGQVAPLGFAVSDDTVFTVVDGEIHRLTLSGASTGAAISLLGEPSQTGMTAAHAGDWLLVGVRHAAAQALRDGSETPILAVTPEATEADAGSVDGAPGIQPPGLHDVFQVTTDGSRFAVKLLNGPQATVHVVSSGRFEPNPAPCVLGPVSNATDGTGLMGAGAQVAWVTQPAAGPYRLHFGAFEPACTVVATVPFGESSTGSRTVGLIDADHALVVTESYAARASVQILSRSRGGPVGAALNNIDVGSGRPLSFVVGRAGAAVLVTGDIPAFIGF